MRTVGTMLIVAHRLSTIQHADNIIVLSHGKILEQGTHQQLLANHGRYYQLYMLQYHKEQLSQCPPPLPGGGSEQNRNPLFCVFGGRGGSFHCSSVFIASTHTGSNSVPARAVSVAAISASVSSQRRWRSVKSATARMRASRGISSPRRPVQ